MNAFAATFITGFKSLWKSPVNVAVLVCFPIVLILILGNALSSYIEADADMESIPVAVAADPGGALGGFLKSGEISRFFTLEFTDEARARQLAADGEAAAAIIESGGDVSVLCPPGGDMYVQVVRSVIDSYKQIGAAAAIAAARGGDIAALLGADIQVSEKPLGKRVPSATDYYAVTMLVMILLYTGMNGLMMFDKGLLSDTGSRARLSPGSMPALIGGLLAASTVTSFLQGMVTFVFSGVVYGVYWGERIPLVLLTLFAVTLFSQSMCILLLMLFKNQGAAAGCMQALAWIMTFVSKGYVKASFGEMDKIFQYAPNALAHTVIFGAIYGGNEGKMMFDLTLLFAVSAVFFILAFLLGRRRLA